MIASESLFHFMDEFLNIPGFPDYSGAVNGLQVEGADQVSRVSAAVDASEETIRMAVASGADLLLVHHGLFWDGLNPLTARRYRKVRALLDGNVALYSAHLPLDAHPEVGNSAVLARQVQVDPREPFGQYEGVSIGWRGSAPGTLEILVGQLAGVVGGAVRHIRADVPGRETQQGCSVAFVTGAGSSFLEEAAAKGVDALVTGEAPHHAYHLARELGVDLILAGHYATETWGVRAMSQLLEERFGLPWDFLDVPTGL